MSEREFKMGAVVELRSGGPPMTVRGYIPQHPLNGVDVEWFIGAVLRHACFPEKALRLSASDRVSGPEPQQSPE